MPFKQCWRTGVWEESSSEPVMTVDNRNVGGNPCEYCRSGYNNAYKSALCTCDSYVQLSLECADAIGSVQFELVGVRAKLAMVCATIDKWSAHPVIRIIANEIAANERAH